MDAEGHGADGQGSRRRLVTGRVLVAAVFLGQVVQTALHYPQLTDRALPIVVSVGCLLVMLLIQLYFASPATRLRSPTSYALLAAQAVLAYLPMAQFGLAWPGPPGFLAGSALLVLRPALGWPVFVVVSASAGWALDRAGQEAARTCPRPEAR